MPYPQNPPRLSVLLALFLILALGLPALAATAAIERLPSVEEHFSQLNSPASQVGYVYESLGSLDEIAETPTVKEEVPFLFVPALHPRCSWPSDWTWQVLPEGLMYTSYLAGVREPRFASQWMSERTHGWMWDIALGGRVGILRHGTTDPLHPEGWQVDIEGAGFPRLDLESNSDLIACDYRFGIPLTHAIGRQHFKTGYYHISSHLGDEWMLRYPGTRRINYSRDAMVMAYSYYPVPDLRFYVEMDYSFGAGERTEPWEFQFGIDYSPAQPTGPRPVPFMAINAHLRQESNFGGNVVVQSGWQWRGRTGHLLRMGMQCFVGMSEQYEFYDQYESKVGFGIWYDY